MGRWGDGQLHEAESTKNVPDAGESLETFGYSLGKMWGKPGIVRLIVETKLCVTVLHSRGHLNEHTHMKNWSWVGFHRSELMFLLQGPPYQGAHSIYREVGIEYELI